VKAGIALALFFFVLEPAMTYGGIWQSRETPTHGVTVHLQGGRVEQGTLSRDWSKAWVLVRDDGAEMRFVDYASMSFTPRSHKQSPSIWSVWRAWLPPLGVMALALALVVAGLRDSCGIREQR
jgi:hypothetical protein